MEQSRWVDVIGHSVLAGLGVRSSLACVDALPAWQAQAAVSALACVGLQYLISFATIG